MKSTWTTEGFAAFRRGTFGNGGHNLYVSRAGILQRIYQYDLNHNGYFDLVYANCQNHHEAAESYLYRKDGSRCAELPGQGSLSGVVADLTGNGYSDIIIGGNYDMAAPFASSDIYFGGTEDYSEKRHIRLPTPFAEATAAGDFDGRGLPSPAFALSKYKTVRIFYHTDLGVEWSRFVDLPIEANQIATTDLDGDGFDELIVKKNDSTEITVYWGGDDGIRIDRCAVLPALSPEDCMEADAVKTLESNLEKRAESPRLLQCMMLGGHRCFVYSSGKKILFYTSDASRKLVLHLALEVPMALSVAVGDIDGNGFEDIAVACRAACTDDSMWENSYIFWGDSDGFRADHFTALKTRRACDVAIVHWDDASTVIFAQGPLGNSYTNRSMLYRWTSEGIMEGKEAFESEDVRRVLVVKNPDRESEILLINHYARSAVGFDRSYIYWGGRDGYDPIRRTEVPCWCAVDSLAADLDDDGWAELVICNNSENSLHLDPGSHVHHFGPNGFEPEKSYLLPTDLAWGAVCADFDRDGYLDLIIAGDHWANLFWFHGGADGWKRETIELNAGGGIRWIIAADLNKNGYLDLIVPLCNGDRTLVLHGGPTGFSMKNHSELAVFHGTCARVADLSGNGYPDVIIGTHIETPRNGELTPHNPHHSFIHIYWNGPEGLRENNKTILRADAAVAMAIADYNNDGWLDIFVSNYHNGKERDINSIIYWNRQGMFRELDRQLLYMHSASGCLAADFNEDGWVDLAVANHKVDGDHHGFSSVWWNGPNGFNQERRIDLPTEGPHGMTSLEPGNLLTRGPEEHYISEPYRMDMDAILEKVVCSGELPPKTWITAEVRHAADRKTLVKAPWQKPGIMVGAGEFVQYRLALGATNSLRTPRIKKVTVTFKETA